MYEINVQNKKVIELVNDAEKKLADYFKYLDEEIYQYNQIKVLNSFIKNKISESHFFESTGYGYNDIGRIAIEDVYKDVFHTEDALVRQQIVSGTHAISLLLYAVCKPYDEILSITGMPYDTILSTLGINGEEGSLKDFNVSFDYVNLINNEFDYDNIKNKIKNNTKLIMIQRSRGYSDKYPMSIESIKKVISFIKNINKDIIVFVDNCYGEFVDKNEPTDVGADVICGSLIKNPGGGLAKSGGYIVGKSEIIKLCAYRLTTPGLGKEIGISYNQNRNVLQGLYLAPQIVNNALKINKLFGKVFNDLGIDTIPRYDEMQNDIVLSIMFNDKERLTDFCNVIQSTSPVDSYLKPVSTDMPGYDSKVIMAAGCFVSGSSIELSCDAPMREPYIAYLQGGLSYYQGKYALIKAIDTLNLYK